MNGDARKLIRGVLDERRRRIVENERVAFCDGCFGAFDVNAPLGLRRIICPECRRDRLARSQARYRARKATLGA